MSIFTTPLQFGYFTALLYAVLFWIRGYREERLPDTLMGFIMFFLGMEIQDYTFGFAGINVLWEELNGFPRYFHIAFAPTIYFYLKALTNRDFKLDKKLAWHYLPYAIYFFSNLAVFLMGSEVVNKVEKFRYAYNINGLEYIAIWISYGIYFYLSLKLYKGYRTWLVNFYSETESIGLIWVRNFIYLIIAGEVFRLIWHLIDLMLGDLPFEQDWWWHLFTVGIIVYVAIRAYYQHAEIRLQYHPQDESTLPVDPITSQNPSNPSANPEWTILKSQILVLFEQDKIFLDPNLSLGDLALRLKTNTSVLSAAINQSFYKNFNDFVNQYRIDEFLRNIKDPQNSHLTLLAVALDSGFNSKSTFNRAFKKMMGTSPREFLD
ncbi:MAG: helix-turn-helix transcriptional regulator [Saprospiraceae bacterium]|nr:helix-turn-helix transcriptional regulator [Saprospiraceae bacterium]